MGFFPAPTKFLLFTTASLVLLLIPGPAVLYVVTRSINQGWRAGLASSSGIATGGLVHAMAAALGLSALLASSAVTYSFMRLAGAAYLVCLGIATLFGHPHAAGSLSSVKPVSLGRLYVQGVVVQILNPKVALFFLAFLPQFADRSKGSVPIQLVFLGTLFSVMSLVTDSLWAILAARVGGHLRGNQRFLRSRDYVAGTVYIGLGLATAAGGCNRPLRS
jgi:threonine/homoserine/homoserine lactone efflux protein